MAMEKWFSAFIIHQKEKKENESCCIGRHEETGEGVGSL